MADIAEIYLRDQLLARRQKLESVVVGGAATRELRQLLEEVDAALGRMEAGTYGICEACHDTIEKDRLLADPLVRYCLDHLTAAGQRALEQDLELAARIQRELLPRQNLSLGEWESAYHYQPLGPVSGDYCDLANQEDGTRSLFFALGDASGKGVAASMLMAQLRAIFRTLIATDLPLDRLVERAGRIFCESTLSSLFATLVCGRAGMSGQVEISNAGHCPALWVHRGGVKRLPATGVPLGMFCDGLIATEKIRLAPGDTLLLYTDGVSEARSESDEEYGEERVCKLLERSHALAPQALIHACLEDLTAFRGQAPLSDDLTLLAIRRTQ